MARKLVLRGPWTLLTSALTHTSASIASERDYALFNGGASGHRDGFMDLRSSFTVAITLHLNNSGHIRWTRRLDKLTYNTLPAWATPKRQALQGIAPANCLGASAGNFALIGVDF